jgi:hypothetical protein
VRLQPLGHLSGAFREENSRCEALCAVPLPVVAADWVQFILWALVDWCKSTDGNISTLNQDVAQTYEILPGSADAKVGALIARDEVALAEAPAAAPLAAAGVGAAASTGTVVGIGGGLTPSTT